MRDDKSNHPHAQLIHVVEQSHNQLANVSEPGVCGARETTRATHVVEQSRNQLANVSEPGV